MTIGKSHVRAFAAVPESKTSDVFQGGCGASGGKVKIFPVAVSEQGDNRGLSQPGDLAVRKSFCTA